MNFFKLLLNNIKEVYREKDFSFLLLSITLFLLPWSVNLSTFTLGLSLVLKLFQVIVLKQVSFSTKALKNSSIIGLFFFIYVLLDSFVQNSVYYTISVFEVEYSHLLLLFLIPFVLRNKRENIILSYFLFMGLIMASVYVFIVSFILKIDFNSDAFSKILDIHHTYLCLFLLLYMNFILMSFFDKKRVNSYSDKAFFLGSIFLSFVIIFAVGSKVSMVVFAIILGIYLIPTFSKKNAFIYIIVFSFLILSFFLFNKKINTSYINALDFRTEIWHESLNSIKENLFFGNLKMSEKNILNLKHYNSGQFYLMDSDLNSHNQYLSILLKYGAIGFSFLILFVINLIKTLSKGISINAIKETFGFGIIIVFIFYIENVLDRHHGIVFCSIFYNYYLVAIQNESI